MEEVEYQISRLATPELYVAHGKKEENDTLFFKQMPIGYYDKDSDTLIIYEQWINVMSNAKFRFVREASE